jgi:phosphopantetheinyl transferase (holo-ACP synthase)
MIGNDVVDLGDPESGAEALHPRFDGRVFDGTERILIEASLHPERTRWLLWSAKESAYKAARKEDPGTVFSPVRFVVRIEGEARASVAVGARRFHVDLVAQVDHVHGVARGARDPSGAVSTALAKLPERSGWNEAVRRLAIATLSPLLGVEPEHLAIHRDGRIPTLWIRGTRSAADLSLSHHGRFVAFACRLP